MEPPRRKAMRLEGFDYSQSGAYFITICVKERRELLWDVGATCGRPQNSQEYLSEYGLMIDHEIQKIEEIYHSSVIVDQYVIMPNHLHMIIVLDHDALMGGRPQVAPTISQVIQQFKGSISKKIGFSPWQKSFHDHIIRDQRDYNKIWQYIDTNPLKWEEDCFYPDRAR